MPSEKKVVDRKIFTPHDDVFVQHLKSGKKHDMPVFHYHDTYEIFLMLDGTRYTFYDDVCYTLKRGSMVILKPFVLHYSQSRDSDFFERYLLNFNIDALAPILRHDEIFLLAEKLNSAIVSLNDEQLKRMTEMFKAVDYYSRQSGIFAQKLTLTAVFQLVAYAAECQGNFTEDVGQDVSPCVIDAITYIKKHYTEIWGLDEIADAANVSKSHLCHRFKECTGVTVGEYLNSVRLTKAHAILLSTDTGIDEAAEKTGFMSAVNLTRAFKKAYGMSPSAFKRSLKK